jgi:hypothetical protein
MHSHEEFVELCAVSISGELTQEERKRLDEHLRGCSSCRKTLEQFKSSVKATVPVAAQEFDEVDADPSFSAEQAEAAFFQRVDREGGFEGDETGERSGGSDDPGVTNGAGWGQLWMPLAAILLLCLALGIASYRMDMKRSVETAGTPQRANSLLAGARERLSDAGHERQEQLAEIEARDQTIADLKKRIHEQLRPKDQQQTATSLNSNGPRSQRLDADSGKVEALQRQLDAEEQARFQLAAHASELETKVADLTKQLQENGLTIAQQKRQLDERESALHEQQELLGHDRDIRDLMGARKLYVVDVYDMGGTGTNKPYGRVFYTQGKSLIFYAYDLDQASSLKKASTFQAWGRRGPNNDGALNLGVFYEDSTTNKRWVVKFDDPKSLAQIDAVFVTVEPDAHGNSPRGKQVLFAYLKFDPNHP